MTTAFSDGGENYDILPLPSPGFDEIVAQQGGGVLSGLGVLFVINDLALLASLKPVFTRMFCKR